MLSDSQSPSYFHSTSPSSSASPIAPLVCTSLPTLQIQIQSLLHIWSPTPSLTSANPHHVSATTSSHTRLQPLCHTDLACRCRLARADAGCTLKANRALLVSMAGLIVRSVHIQGHQRQQFLCQSTFDPNQHSTPAQSTMAEYTRSDPSDFSSPVAPSAQASNPIRPACPQVCETA